MTQKRWGATPEEWAIFTDKLDLTEDLLPVVSNPRAEISKKSTMKDIGKTPSQYDQFGHVTGIGKWTARISEPKRVASWGHEPDYGICVQTRHVRAIDIDIEDGAKAREIAEHVAFLLRFHLPMRYRKDSGKCLLAVRVEGEFAKRVIHTDHGMVEFLANGQQFIAAGTHPKGARYEWAWPGGVEDIPTITKEQWDRVFDGVFEFYGNSKTEGGRLRKHSDGEQEVVSDRVSEWLGDQGLVIDYGSEGECYIECPFSDQHTSESGITATAYFPAGSRGYEQGHFKCMHAHCDGRNDLEFEGALGYSAAQFDDLPAETVN